MRLVLSGSSSGIGRDLVEHLLSAGHEIWGLARSDQSSFAAGNARFRCSICDVADYHAVAQAAATLAPVWPYLDGLITCAGMQGEISRTLSSNPERWAATVRANFDGTYHVLRAFAPLLLRAPRRAKIICFSGGGATKARANFSAYGCAKTAIVRLVETIAVEEQSQSLDINAVAPGAINTRLTDEVIALGPAVVGDAEYRAALKQKQTGGVSMGKVCNLINWLLSPTSDGVSGRLISAPWDPWETLGSHTAELSSSDIYTLRRITPEERGKRWSC